MRTAVLTMSYNERSLLPIWVKYYGSAFGFDSLFIADHGSDPGALAFLPAGVSVLRIPRENYSEVPRLRLINALKDGLLNYFDCVIYTDVDEIIVPDPAKYGGLADYCRDCAPVVAPVGLELFHLTGVEPPLDLHRPVLSQREHCYFSSAFSKPAILKTRVKWSPGFHFCDKLPTFADDLYTFHLKSVDIRLSLERLALTRAMQWDASDLERGRGRHQRRTDADHAAQYFEKPAARIARNGLVPFDFAAEVARVRAETRDSGKFFAHDWIRGEPAKVPERFREIF